MADRGFLSALETWPPRANKVWAGAERSRREDFDSDGAYRLDIKMRKRIFSFSIAHFRAAKIIFKKEVETSDLVRAWLTAPKGSESNIVIRSKDMRIPQMTIEKARSLRNHTCTYLLEARRLWNYDEDRDLDNIMNHHWGYYEKERLLQMWIDSRRQMDVVARAIEKLESNVEILKLIDRASKEN